MDYSTPPPTSWCFECFIIDAYFDLLYDIYIILIHLLDTITTIFILYQIYELQFINWFIISITFYLIAQLILINFFYTYCSNIDYHTTRCKIYLKLLFIILFLPFLPFIKYILTTGSSSYIPFCLESIIYSMGFRCSGTILMQSNIDMPYLDHKTEQYLGWIAKTLFETAPQFILQFAFLLSHSDVLLNNTGTFGISLNFISIIVKVLCLSQLGFYFCYSINTLTIIFNLFSFIADLFGIVATISWLTYTDTSNITSASVFFLPSSVIQFPIASVLWFDLNFILYIILIRRFIYLFQHYWIHFGLDDEISIYQVLALPFSLLVHLFEYCLLLCLKFSLLPLFSEQPQYFTIWDEFIKFIEKGGKYLFQTSTLNQHSATIKPVTPIILTVSTNSFLANSHSAKLRRIHFAVLYMTKHYFGNRLQVLKNLEQFYQPKKQNYDKKYVKSENDIKSDIIIDLIQSSERKTTTSTVQTERITSPVFSMKALRMATNIEPAEKIIEISEILRRPFWCEYGSVSLGTPTLDFILVLLSLIPIIYNVIFPIISLIIYLTSQSTFYLTPSVIAPFILTICYLIFLFPVLVLFPFHLKFRYLYYHYGRYCNSSIFILSDMISQWNAVCSHEVLESTLKTETDIPTVLIEIINSYVSNNTAEDLKAEDALQKNLYRKAGQRCEMIHNTELGLNVRYWQSEADVEE